MYISCMILGWIISLLSTLLLTQFKEKPHKFAIVYTTGHIVSLAATGLICYLNVFSHIIHQKICLFLIVLAFLWGPRKQLKSMFAGIRIIATLSYLAFLILVLVLAFMKAQVSLIVLAIIGQFLAMVWYNLSYFPFGRTIAKKMASALCC